MVHSRTNLWQSIDSITVLGSDDRQMLDKILGVSKILNVLLIKVNQMLNHSLFLSGDGVVELVLLVLHCGVPLPNIAPC